MGNNIYTEKELAQLFAKDASRLTPDHAVRERLEYTFLLKSAAAKVNQNSFLGMFTWLFSWSHLPLKAAMVSLIIVLSFFKIPDVEQQFMNPAQDTTYNTIPLHIDSSGTSPYYADTCLTTKVNAKVDAWDKGVYSGKNFFRPCPGQIQRPIPRNTDSTARPGTLFLSRHTISRRSEPAGLSGPALSESRRLA